MRITKNPVIGMWEKAESELPDIQSRDPLLVPCQPGTVLIVDDELNVRRVFSMVLSNDRPNIIIEQAGNGAKGVDAFKLGHQAVILMDLSMPVMDGEAAFLEIQAHCKSEGWVMPSVVFCTGFNPSVNLRNIVAGNPRHCMLQKPVRNPVLVEAVQAGLDRA